MHCEVHFWWNELIFSLKILCIVKYSTVFSSQAHPTADFSAHMHILKQFYLAKINLHKNYVNSPYKIQLAWSLGK